MIVCSICSHNDWCDGPDACDCGCHDVEDDLDEDDEEINYEED
jgi:hypothetical protein